MLNASFDIGNVLVEMDLQKFTIALQQYIAPEHDPWFFLQNLQALQDVGLSTVRQSLRSRHDLHDPEVLEKLIKIWNQTLSPNEMMLKFLDNLKHEGVKIALLSNMGAEHAQYLKNNYPELFANTLTHLSYEVGARKPSKLYYQSFLMDHAEFVGSVYVDDLPENLVTGKLYKFKTFNFNLASVLTWTKSQQHRELDKIKSYIFDGKY